MVPTKKVHGYSDRLALSIEKQPKAEDLGKTQGEIIRVRFLPELGHGGTVQGESQGRLMEREHKHTLRVFLILPAGPGAD